VDPRLRIWSTSFYTASRPAGLESPCRIGAVGAASAAQKFEAVHIAFACPFGLTRKATVWARILPLAARLAGRGHGVRVVVPPWDAPAEADSRLLYRNVEVYRVGVEGGLLPTTMRMQWRLQEFRPDIVHVVKPRAYAGISQFLTCLQRSLTRRRRPVIVLDLDDWEQAWTPGLAAHPVLARFLAWQEEWGVRHCDGLSVASQWLWRRTRHIVPAVPRLYLPNGVERAPSPRHAAAAESTEHTAILWVTRFVEVSPAWLSRFWARLRALMPQCRLTVAGSSIEPGLDLAFEAAFSAAGQWQDEVEFLGHVAYGELPALYARSRCVIAPAREEAASLAKCSVKLLDSVRYGIRCVASTVGEQARFQALSSAVFLGPEAPPEQFAETVARTLQARPPESYAVGSAGGHTVPNWESLALRLERFYEALRDQGR